VMDAIPGFIRVVCTCLSLYLEYSDKAYLQFYCRRCASDSNGNFDFLQVWHA